MSTARTLIIAILAIVSACRTDYISHSPEMGVEVAQTFCHSAFVDRDYARAYSLASEEIQSIDIKALETAIVETQSPRPFPQSVRSVGYELVPGRREMIVYLDGESDHHTSHYRLRLVGDGRDGYRVLEVLRSDESYPVTRLRQLVEPQ